ncbi:MAG: hypothetical protein AB7V50_02195 [Vampirovibrionia bacterium]
MDDSTIKQLIQSIKELAESHTKSNKEAINKFESLYNETKDENKELRSQLNDAQYKIIESMIEIKYLQQRIDDLENNKLLTKDNIDDVLKQ